MKYANIEMPLGGLDTFTDAKHVLPGKLDVAENVRFHGPPGFSKRFGYERLTKSILGGGTMSVSSRLTDHRGIPFLFTERELYTFGVQANKWIFRGAVSEAQIGRTPVYYDQRLDVRAASVAVNTGVTCTLWGEGTFTASVSNANDGVLSKESTTLGANARVLSVGNFIYIIRQNVTALEWMRIDVTSGVYTFSAPAAFGVNVITMFAGAIIFDAVPLTGTTDFLVAFKNTGTGFVTVVRRTTSNTEIWRTPVGETADDCIGLMGTAGEDVYVAWGSNANGVKYAVIDPTTGTLTSGPTTIDNAANNNDATRIGIVRYSTTEAIVVWGVEKQDMVAIPVPPSGYMGYTRYRRVSDGGGLGGSPRVLYDCMPVTRPWLDTASGRFYLGVVFHEPEQPAGFILEIGTTGGEQDPRWAATFARDMASGFATSLGVRDGASDGVLSNVYETTPGARTYVFGALLRQQLTQAKLDDGAVSIPHRGVGIVTVNLSALDRFAGCAWDRGYFIAGGKPSWYDGFSVVEHGFAWSPSVNRDDTAASPSNTDDLNLSAPGVLNPGAGAVMQKWFARVVFEAEDANAMVARSAPSLRLMSEEDNQTNSKLQWTQKSALLTDRRPASGAWWSTGATPPCAMVYRTVQAPTEETLYRATLYAGFTITADPIAGTVSEFGTSGNAQADSDIILREVIYTTGDILANDGTPPCKYCTIHGDRLWIAGLEDPKEFWFSQPFVQTEQPRFSGFLKLHIDTDVTGLASMDDKLVVFGAQSIYIVTGDGCPTTGGVDLGFDTRLVTSDVGCRESRSIVRTPLGLMFWSYKGIYLLDRALQLTYIGAPLHRTLLSTWTIVGGALNVKRNEVAFAVNIGFEDGKLLVYNYLTQIWTVDVLPDVPFSCSMIYPETSAVFAFVNGFGQVYTESATFGDANDTAFPAFIPSRIVTPWLKPSTVLQGWGEIGTILFLGNNNGRHQAQVRIAFDYNESGWDETFTFTNAELEALDRYQYEVKPERQQCEALRIEWSDLADDTFGGDQSTGGGALSSIVFRAGLIDQTVQLEPEARH